jgi:hypothetical protein
MTFPITACIEAALELATPNKRTSSCRNPLINSRSDETWLPEWSDKLGGVLWWRRPVARTGNMPSTAP